MAEAPRVSTEIAYLDEETSDAAARAAHRLLARCRHGFPVEVGCWREECWPAVGQPVEWGR